MLNQVVLIGRLTKIPEVHITTEQKAVLNITLALNRYGRSKWKEQEADFISCVLWGKQALDTGKYCDKGSLVAINGEIQTRSYLNKEEQKIYTTEVIVRQVRFLSSSPNKNKNEKTYLVEEEG